MNNFFQSLFHYHRIVVRLKHVKACHLFSQAYSSLSPCTLTLQTPPRPLSIGNQEQQKVGDNSDGQHGDKVASFLSRTSLSWSTALSLCLSFTATIRWTDELTHTDRSMLMSLETDQGAPYLNFEKETVNTKAEVFLQTVREWMILLFGSGLWFLSMR